MESSQDVSDEAFAAREREIADLFSKRLADAVRTGPEEYPGGSTSDERVERILARARMEPTAEGRVRIDRIITRLKADAGAR